MTLSAVASRKEHQRLRHRLLYGQADEDIRSRIIAAVGGSRMAAWGPLDLTSNPFLSVWGQAAATYRTAPAVFAPPGGEQAAIAIEAAGYWPLMQRVQRDTLAMREMLVRIDVDDTGELYIVPVHPFLVDVEVDPRNPYRAVAVREEREDPDDGKRKVYVTCDPRSRLYYATDEHGTDVSERVLGGLYSGQAYPFTDADGIPLLPYVTYRAALTGSYWDAFTGRELVETSLQLGVLYSFFMHCVKDASWPQRYAVDMEAKGAVDEHGDHTSGRHSGIVTDPALLLQLQSTSVEGTSGQIGQWGAASDPETLLRAIQAYERRAVDAALGTANVSRTTSDIRSGYSLAVSREEQRELQRSYEPVFRRSDLELLGKVSALLGGPSTGWRIEYKALPKDPAEHAAELDRLTKAIEAGLMSKVDAYLQLHPQMSTEEAEAALRIIGTINRQFAA